MARLYQELREPKVVKRIAELKAMGMDDDTIANIINEEMKLQTKATKEVIGNIVKTLSIRGTEFLKKDEEVANLYKEVVNQIIDEGRNNIGVLIKIRAELETKLNEMRDAADTKAYVTFSREVKSTVSSINDTLRTVNSLLERLEAQKAEYSVSSVQTTAEIVKALKEYEKLGMIQINPEFAKSPLFTYSNEKNERREENGEED